MQSIVWKGLSRRTYKLCLLAHSLGHEEADIGKCL